MLWTGKTTLSSSMAKISNSVTFGSRSGISFLCLHDFKSSADVYGVFAGLCTAYAAFQMINLIGETILEYSTNDQPMPHVVNGECPSSMITVSDGQVVETNNIMLTTTGQPAINANTNNRANNSIDRAKGMLTDGFQLIHGWTETLIAIGCFDIPQTFIAMSIAVHCQCNLGQIITVLIWYLFKALKNGFRYGTCRQRYTTCSQECQESECCLYTCNVICLCKMFFLRLCPDNNKFLEVEEYKICPHFNTATCERSGRVFGPIQEDPRCSKYTFVNMSTLSGVLYGLLLFLQIMSGLGYFGDSSNNNSYEYDSGNTYGQISWGK